MTKTGKVPTLNKLNPGPFVEIHPGNASSIGVKAKDLVKIRSRRGRAVLPAVVTDRVQPGNCFTPFHRNDIFGENLAINAVTNDAVDPISLQPEFKFCAVALQRAEAMVSPFGTAEADRQVLVRTAAVASAAAGQAAVARIAATGTRGTPLDMSPSEAIARILGLNAAQEIVLDDRERLYMQGFVSGLAADNRAEGIPVLPVSAPLRPDVRLLLDGMLAGLFSRSGSVAGALSEPVLQTQHASIPVMVFWASQIGKAETFAGECARALEALGHPVRLDAMDAVEPAELAGASVLLLLASTFGDGDAPDNGAVLWSGLASDKAPRLDDMRFSVLAFGDSSYDQFCGFGRKLDARLEALGGQCLAPRVDCEPEYKESAKGWLDTVVTALQTGLTPPSAAVRPPSLVIDDQGLPERLASAKAVTTDAKSRFTRNEPFRARLIGNRLLNGESSEKETRQFVFDLDDSLFEYEAGDALGVWPRNDPVLVTEIMSTLELSAGSPVPVPGIGDMPLAEALSIHYEITRTTPEMFQFIAERSGSTFLLDLMLEESRSHRTDWLWGRQFIDLLHAYPVRADMAELLALLKRLQPRLYSISSSPLAYPRQVHLTTSTVRYANDGRRHGGVCSTFLADRACEIEVPIFVQKSLHFRPPKDPSLPMIMIGPGTGIAPFRVFLQERQATGASGRNWLFFGEQHEQTDLYYRDELEAMQRSGLLYQLDTAFSRDQAGKVYVQDRMAERGEKIWSWLQEGAHFYACGDGNRMAKDVDATLRQIVQVSRGLKPDDAAYVAAMAKEKRYVREVY